MKMFKTSFIALICVILTTNFFSCSKNDPEPEPLTAIIFKDLNADYAPLVLNSGGPPSRPTQTKKFTFFSFKTGAIVLNADSASTKWDIGFRSTTIIFNGGTSGPGTAGAIVQKGIFDEIKTAPTSGYVLDNKNTPLYAVSSSPFVAGTTTTTNNWWLNSGTQTSTIVSPIAGNVILVKTADGRYAKMEILSFYKGSPAVVDNLKDLDRHYTFRYIYQKEEIASF